MPLARTRVVLFPPESPDASTSADAAAAFADPAASPTSPSTSSPEQPTDAILVTGGVLRVPPPGERWDSLNPNMEARKEPQVFLTPGQGFDFSLTIPAHHYRDENIDLPPTCQVFQVGIQAGVEYILRVKLSRKGWRLNEQ